jgi:thiol-disulfide isomerase/thioredoxin
MSHNIKLFNMSLEEFQSLQSNNPNKVYFVDFMANWCGPCKTIKPFIQETAKNCMLEGKNIEFYMVVSDDEKNEELVQYYNITALPTFMLFKKGITLSTITGANKIEISDAIKKAI